MKHHSNATPSQHASYLAFAGSRLTGAAKCAFTGGTLGVAGGAFLGAVVDSVTIAASGNSALSLFHIILSVLGSVGTGAAIGGSALACVGAAAGAIIGANTKTETAVQPPLIISQHPYRISIPQTTANHDMRNFNALENLKNRPVVVCLEERQTIN